MSPASLDGPITPGSGISTAVAETIPLATSYHGQLSAQRTPVQQVIQNPTGYAAGQSGVGSFINKVKALGSESAHLVEGAANWVKNAAVGMAEAPVKFTIGLGKAGSDAYQAYVDSQNTDELSKQLDQINSMYKSGRLTTQAYKDALNEYGKQIAEQGQKNADLVTKAKGDEGYTLNGLIGTAGDILTVMTAGTGSAEVAAGERAAAGFLGSEAADAALQPAEQALSKIAASKAALAALPNAAKNATTDAIYTTLFQGAKGATSAQLTRAAAANLMFKYPLTFNALDGTGKQIYEDLQAHKYGSAVKNAAFNAALLLSGGPIGYALKKGGQALGVLNRSVFGDQGFIETLAKRIGADATEIRTQLTANPEIEKNFAAMASTNINAEKGNIRNAVERFVGGLQTAGWDIGAMTPEQLVKDPQNWADAARIQQEELLSKGMTQAEADRYTVGRWTVSDANFVAAQITQSEPGIELTSEDMMQRWEQLKQQLPSTSWANNQSLNSQIERTIQSGRNVSDVETKIRTIEAQFGTSKLSEATQAKLAKMGYVEIQPVNIEAPFREAGSADAFSKAASSVPVLGSIGDMLTKAGLSPNAATERVYQLFTRNFGGILEDVERDNPTIGLLGGLSGEEGAQNIMGKLSDYAKETMQGFSLKHPPITDLRQMSSGEIQKALGSTKDIANTVRDALADAYIRVPLEVRGLGDRVVDINYKVNPASRYYARLQGALRYAYNPFFKARLAYKAEALSQLEAGGKFPTILGTNRILQTVVPDKYKELDEISSLAEQRGIFGAGYAAEGADEQAAGYKSLGHELLQSQKRSVAGLIGVMADRAGMTPGEFMDAFPNETKDTVRMILQYDPRANFLNSPMARTLNYAFFPFRFNLKVTTIMARTLAKQPLGVQYATIVGVMRAHQWLNSPEGMSWYSKNSDVIKLFEYFSPLETISSISQALSGLDSGSWQTTAGAFGELGGLPFGFIPGLLSAEGLLNTGSPYVNPTTGAIAQDYVPISARGRAKAAIEDFIGALFTYPGSEIGLPSKTKVDVSIANALVPGGSTKQDFKTTTPQLTPQQQAFQQAVQALHGTTGTSTPPAAQPQSPPQTVPGVQVPMGKSPLNPNNVPPSGRTTKKKKADFRPYLLPGQSQLGQL